MIYESKLDKAIEEAARKSVVEEWPELMTSVRPPYEVGQTIQVKAYRIMKFGVFCHTLDDQKYSALLHISEITGGHISDIEEYFEVGDEFEAIVKAIKEENNSGIKVYKLELSTKSFNPKPKSERPFNQLAAIRDQLGDGAEEMNNKVVTVIKSPKKDNGQENHAFSQYPKDIRKMLTFIENTCGMVSQESRERVVKIAEEYGVFLTTKAMIEAEEEFSRDLSHHFLNEVEKRIGDDL